VSIKLRVGLIGACLCQVAYGTDYTWEGSTTSWSDSNNWSPNGVPGQSINDTATIVSAANPPTFDVSIGYGNLVGITFDQGGPLTIAPSYILYLNGNMSGTGTVILEDGTTFSFIGGSASSTGSITYQPSSSATIESGGLDFEVNSVGQLSPGTASYTNQATGGIATLSLNSSDAVTLQSIYLVNGSDSIYLTNPLTLLGNSSIAGQISGSSSFTFDGSGQTLQLSFDNQNFNGEMQIEAGILALVSGGSISQATSVAVDGTFDISQTSSGATINNLSGSGLVVLGSQSLTINQSSPGEFSGSFGGSGGVTIEGAAPLTLSGTSAYTGPTNILGQLLFKDSGAIPLTSAFNLTGALDISRSSSTASICNLSGSGSINLGQKTLTIVQDATGTFSGKIQGQGGIFKEGTGLFILSGVNTYEGGTVLSEGSLQVLNSSGLGTSTLTISDSANLILDTGITLTNPFVLSGDANITVANADTATCAGVISDIGTMTKEGTGTLVLSAINTYAGATTISAGTLQLSGLGAISDSTSVDVVGVLDLTLTTSTNEIGTLSGTGSIFMGSSEFVVNQATASTFSGVISGTANLIKEGSSTLTLSGANTYTGPTLIDAGTLKLGTVGAIANSSAVDVVGRLDVTTNGANIQTLSGSGTIALGTQALTVTQNTSQLFSGVLSGVSGSLIKTGSATLALSGMNTYGGGTTLNAGILEIGHNSALGTNTLTIAGGELLLDNNISCSNAVALTGAAQIATLTSASATLSGTITGTGSINKIGTGTLVLSGNSSYTGGTSLSAGTLSLANSHSLGTNTLTMTDQTALILANAITASNALIFNGEETITVNGTDTGTLSGVLSGSGSLTKSGTGTLVLGGSNTYGGGTTLSSGILSLQNNIGLGTNSLTMEDGTTLALLGGIASANPVVLMGAETITINSGTGTLSGVISGAGSLTLPGNGTLVLSGINTYAGITGIQAGTLALTGLGSIAQASAVNVLGVLDISNTTAGTSINTLSGSGSVTLGNQSLTIHQLSTGTFSGSLNGSGSVIKQESGTLVWTGANGYTGTTNVSGGTLLVNNSLSSTLVDINSGGILGGYGPFIGNIVLHEGGQLSPGNSIGTLVGASFTFNPGSLLVNELNHTSGAGNTDVVEASSNFTLSNTAPGVTLEIDAIGSLAHYQPGTTYTIVNAGTVSGTFATVTNPLARHKLIFDVIYTPTTIVVVLVGKNAFTSIIAPTATQNAFAVANYMDYLESSGFIVPNTDLDTVFNVAAAADPDQLAAGLNTMQPAPYTTLVVAQEQTMLDLQTAIENRLDQLDPYCLQPTCMYAWLTPMGSYARLLAPENNSGYDAYMGGFALGVDRLFNAMFCSGLSFGYTHTNVNWGQPTGSGNIQTGYVGYYSRLFTKAFSLDAGVTAGVNFFRGHRPIYMTSASGTIDRTAQSRYQGAEADLHVGLETVIYNNPLLVQLFATLDWVYTHQHGFVETEAQSLNLDVNDKSYNLLRPELGVMCSKQFHHCKLEGGLAGVYYSRLRGSAATANFFQEPGNFVTYGTYPSQVRAVPQARLTGLSCGNRIAYEIAYEGEFSTTYFENNLFLSLGCSF